MRLIAILSVLFALLLTAAAGLWYYSASVQDPEAQSVPIGGPFELVGTDGQTVTENDFAKRHMLIYFGYTYCPDVCPLSLQNMVEAYALLSPEVKAELVPVFISVDPERDTVEVVKEYVAFFDPSLVGLTGSVDQIEAVKKTFRVYAQKSGDTDSDDYLVDHSSFFYLMDGNGQYVTHFGHDATPGEMSQRIEDILG